MPNKQKGLALMLLVFVLVFAVAAYSLKGLNASGIATERDEITVQALAEAKAALIGYAVTYDDDPGHAVKVYGYLPCPDHSTVGGAGSELVCGNSGNAAIGRLPWKTLKIAPITGGYGECLWYAVSGNFKNNPKLPLNPTTPGQLSIKTAGGDFYAGSDVDPVVAIVFAPGSAVNNQDRTDSGEDEYCGGNYVASNYLDTVNNISNADASDFTFVVDDSATFNDKLILITQSEMFKSYCGKYARKLASNVDIVNNSNSCLDTGTGAASTACVTMRDNVQFCDAASCRTAADTLIDSICLNNPSDAACLAGINELELCHA